MNNDNGCSKNYAKNDNDNGNNGHDDINNTYNDGDLIVHDYSPCYLYYHYH